MGSCLEMSKMSGLPCPCLLRSQILARYLQINQGLAPVDTCRMPELLTAPLVLFEVMQTGQKPLVLTAAGLFLGPLWSHNIVQCYDLKLWELDSWWVKWNMVLIAGSQSGNGCIKPLREGDGRASQ